MKYGEIFGSNTTLIVHEMTKLFCSEDYIDQLLAAMFSTNENALKTLALSIAEKNSYWKLNKDEFSTGLNHLFNQPRYINSLYLDIQKILYHGSRINPDDVFRVTNLQIFWHLLALSSKKCLHPKKHTAVLKWEDVNTYLTPCTKEQRKAFNACLDGFSKDYETPQAKLPYLSLLLHEHHRATRTRVQKKNLSRVERQAKKVMLCYRIANKNGRYFADEKHEVPKKFCACIRKASF